MVKWLNRNGNSRFWNFYLSIPHKDIVDLRFIFSQNITLNENIRVIPDPNLKIRTNEKAIPKPRGTVSWRPFVFPQV